MDGVAAGAVFVPTPEVARRAAGSAVGWIGGRRLPDLPVAVFAQVPTGIARSYSGGRGRLPPAKSDFGKDPMPDIDDLQTEYDELTRTIRRQNELRDSGSDDYDWNKLDDAINRRNQVQRSIEETGRTPGGDRPPTDSPSGGDASSAPSEPPLRAPDPGESTIDQLEHQLGQLRDNPPHPGVRMEDGKVVGGTAEDLQEQLEWRARVDRLDHELTAAQADKAWAEAGGPDGFTDAELEGIERAGEKIDGIQDRLDAVQSRIDGLNARLDEARGVLDGQTAQGGGPNAAGGAAIAVGARIMGELRDLEAQKAAVQQELNDALEALATIIRTRVRSQLEGSGLEVGLPGDRKGRAAVEEAFLRRVYRRLGLDYLPNGAPGLLRGLSGAQSRRPEARFGVPALAAIAALIAIGLVVLFLVSRDDVSTPVVAISPTTQSTEETSAVAVETPTSASVVIPADGADVTGTDDKALQSTSPAVATSIGIPYSCAEVIHSSLVGFSNSLSYFMLSMLVGGVDGIIPEGTTLTVDAGGLAPNSAPIRGYLADVPIPIDRYGSYPVTSITAEGPDGPIEVQFLIEPVIVDSSEGSVGDCEPPAEALASGRGLAGGFGGELWFGDGPLSTPDEPTDDDDTPDFQVFLDSLDIAHQSGDVDALLGSLDQATIDRYGSDQCRAYMEQVAGSFADPTLVSAGAEPWDYLTDGVSTNVPDAWNLLIDVTLGGTRQQVPMHVRPVDDQIYWFTDCGQPSD